MLNNCAIFCSQELGEIPESLHESALDAFTIAVDGGARHLSELGLKPSLWVGDGDSIQTDPKNLSCPVLKFPREKTFSDLEGALTCAGEAYLDGAW